MACSKQSGPASYIHFIECNTGETITQQDWHGLRLAAQADGYTLSRSRVPDSMTEKMAASLARNIGVTDKDKVDALKAKMAETNNTVATTSVIDYLTRFGVKEALEKVRADRNDIGKVSPMDDELATRSYESRVQALEDEGIDTSDAQAMVDAEDYTVALIAADTFATSPLKRFMGEASDDMDLFRGVDAARYSAAKVRLDSICEVLARRGEIILTPGLHYMKFVDEPSVPKEVRQSFEYSFGAMTDIKFMNKQIAAGNEEAGDDAYEAFNSRAKDRFYELSFRGMTHSEADAVIEAEEGLANAWSKKTNLTGR